MIEFKIPGRPQPQERPLVLKRGWTIDRPTSAAAKKLIQMIALNARQGAKLSVSAKDFRIQAYFINPHGSSDIDNLCKLVLDGLKGVFWHDDKQVMHLVGMKVISHTREAQTEILIEELSNDK